MQLLAYGAQDVYLTGNPQITFLRVTYRHHTNFAMESIDIEVNNSDPITIPKIIIKYHRLDPDDAQCVISLELIEENVEYWQCNTCHKVVSWQVAELWVSQHKSCPHCRQIAGLDTKHVNGPEPPTDF